MHPKAITRDRLKNVARAPLRPAVAGTATGTLPTTYTVVERMGRIAMRRYRGSLIIEAGER